MVSDVRFKVLMRLRRELELIRLEMLQDRRLWGEVVLARTEPDIAKAMSARYRTRILNQFPGCTITFLKAVIYIKLPEGYPDHAIPVCEQLSPRMIECFTPAGLTNKSTEGG